MMEERNWIHFHFKSRRTAHFFKRLGPSNLLQVYIEFLWYYSPSLARIFRCSLIVLFCLYHSLAALLSTKRNRASIQQDHVSAQRLQELQHVVEQQAAEIQRLSSENDSAQRSAAELSSQHAKVEHENKILKRAVAIQQDRQNQLTAELEGARQYKLEAEDRIHRLEQMNLTLQYQLQQSNSTPGDDFMGSPTWGF